MNEVIFVFIGSQQEVVFPEPIWWEDYSNYVWELVNNRADLLDQIGIDPMEDMDFYLCCFDNI